MIDVPGRWGQGLYANIQLPFYIEFNLTFDKRVFYIFSKLFQTWGPNVNTLLLVFYIVKALLEFKWRNMK